MKRYLGVSQDPHPHVAPGFWEKFYFRQERSIQCLTWASRIGVYICYDRHFPEARALGLNGAEIVFNPSPPWPAGRALVKLEQPAHASRMGISSARLTAWASAPWNIGEFYGSSYFYVPRGQIVAQASRERMKC
jgi:N-carbamoylputrescine amidase